MAELYDDRPCELGEGPLWHPERACLYWFDILGSRLLGRGPDGPGELALPEMFSAAGLVDRDRLFAASETGFWLIRLDDGTLTRVARFAPDDPGVRSNDGRADPWGGFWIGTMGKDAEPARGAIRRWFKGEARVLFDGLTIPNAISFTPDRRFAHFADSAARKVWRVALDGEGWPAGQPSVFADFAGRKGVPDGAVCDAEGNLWLAVWGEGAVICLGPDGTVKETVKVGGVHSSCPAFGGPDRRTLFVTTAREGLPPETLSREPRNGCVFTVRVAARGLPEPYVLPGGSGAFAN